MYTDIQKLGAQAAREGLSLLDCPYLKAEAMPGHTGESPHKWQQRVTEWEMGWKQATAQRGSLRSADVPTMSGARSRARLQ